MVTMPHWPIPLGSKPSDYTLNTILELLRRLGNPHLSLPPVIHVAGTNGKGSTLAFLKSILEAAGYRVHRYISPHLVAFNERITLAGETIDDELLYEVIETCRMAASDMKVTFFEGTTAAALLAFSKVKADVVLLETGLGGRLDATNVIPKPAVTCITSISLEHTEYLGPTLPIIAREKAGIMRSDVPCVVSAQEPEVMAALEDAAGLLHTPLFRFGYEWNVERRVDGFLYREGEGARKLPAPSLLGAHQMINAGNAVACLECAPMFKISEEAYHYGVSRATWPARMEPITKGALVEMLPKTWELWLDGAHNRAGTEMVAQQLTEWDACPTIFICGFTKGRDAAHIMAPLMPLAEAIITVRVESEPSATPANILASELKAGAVDKDIQAAGSIEEAMDMILQQYGNCFAKARIMICGSLYLAADVKMYNQR